MAVNFTATNQQITSVYIPTDQLPAITLACTIEAVSTSNAYVFSQAINTTSNIDYAINISNGKKVNVKLNINGTVRTLGTTGGISDTSTTVCATYNGSQLQLWVDGVLEETAAYTGPVRSTPGRLFCIGGYGSSQSTWGFLGKVSDVRMYNRALSAKEIEQYTVGQGQDGIYNGLLAWYQLNEAPVGTTISPTLSNTVKDHGPNRYDGKTVGFSPIWDADPRQFTKTRLIGI
jgi:hypothetical protein